jgi:hypothetical protein
MADRTSPFRHQNEGIPNRMNGSYHGTYNEIRNERFRSLVGASHEEKTGSAAGASGRVPDEGQQRKNNARRHGQCGGVRVCEGREFFFTIRSPTRPWFHLCDVFCVRKIEQGRNTETRMFEYEKCCWQRTGRSSGRSALLLEFVFSEFGRLVRNRKRFRDANEGGAKLFATWRDCGGPSPQRLENPRRGSLVIDEFR